MRLADPRAGQSVVSLSFWVGRYERRPPRLAAWVFGDRSWASPRSFDSPRLGTRPLRGLGSVPLVASPSCSRSRTPLVPRRRSARLWSQDFPALAGFPSLAVSALPMDRGRLRPAEGRAGDSVPAALRALPGVRARRGSGEGRRARRGGCTAPERSLVGSIARGSQRHPLPSLLHGPPLSSETGSLRCWASPSRSTAVNRVRTVSFVRSSEAVLRDCRRDPSIASARRRVCQDTGGPSRRSRER